MSILDFFGPSQISSEMSKAYLLKRVYLVENVSKVKLVLNSLPSITKSFQNEYVHIDFSENKIRVSKELANLLTSDSFLIVQSYIGNNFRFIVKDLNGTTFEIINNRDNIEFNYPSKKIVLLNNSHWITSINIV